jgi:hypothetical protein
MPIHDWTRVEAGIFQDFHSTWMIEIKRVLNAGLLPASYYALAEQIAGGREPDVLTLQVPESSPPVQTSGGGLALEESPPRVSYRRRAESSRYAAKARRLTVRHVSNHKVVAMLEIVSPGNKSSRERLDDFVAKAQAILMAGVHLLVVDLFPPGPRDPEGIHPLIWPETVSEFALPADKPLVCASYIGEPSLETFVEPVAVGDSLPDMPLFLDAGRYIPVPLNATYDTAWEAVPAFWRDVLAG